MKSSPQSCTSKDDVRSHIEHESLNKNSFNTNDTVNTEKRKSQRLSYVGSEINIIPNPQTEEYETEVSNPNSPEDQQPMIPMKDKRPPPPIPQSNEDQICPELPRKKRVSRPPNMIPLQNIKRPQAPQLMMTRPGQPMGASRLPPEYPRGRPVTKRPQPPLELMKRRQRQRMIEEEEQLQPLKASVATSPMDSMPRKQIDSATFTKKSRENNESEPVLPVGYPLFASNDMSGSVYSDPPQRMHTPPNSLSPLDVLPNPSDFGMGSPPEKVRQSPASALPPMTDTEEQGNDAIVSIEEDEDEEMPVNPALDLPSPPRLGAPTRLFENPFDLADDESRPIEPEKKLSPNHIFQSASGEDNEDNKDDIEAIFEKATKEEEDFFDNAQKEYEMGMDYEQLMSYFESLKESNA